jgi:AcrR family transcriptional regulator
MPKRVDSAERRQHIARALLRVVSRDGLGAVSLRHVAAEAGVTAGMVQHYFPSKHDMMLFAMRTASERYELRITERIARLGDGVDARQIVRVLVGSFLPTTEAEADDARVALAFQAYAAHNDDAAAHLDEGNRLLLEHLAALLASAGSGGQDPRLAATALVATAEGLAVATLSARLPTDVASRALEAHLSTLWSGPAT